MKNKYTILVTGADHLGAMEELTGGNDDQGIGGIYKMMQNAAKTTADLESLTFSNN